MPSQSYESLEAEWHDLFWREEGEAAELPLMQSLLQEKTSAEVLYIGSGSGRLLLPLLSEEVKITAIEPSPDMIRLCRQQLRPQQESHLELCESSWEDFSLEKTYDLILIPSFTFQLFPEPQAAVEKLCAALKPDGRLYVTLFFPWAEILGDVPEKRWFLDRESLLEDGTKARLETRFRLDERRQLLKRDHRYLHKSAGGKVLRSHESRQEIHWFTDAHIHQMCQDHHLEIAQEINDFGADREEDEPISVITLILRKKLE